MKLCAGQIRYLIAIKDLGVSRPSVSKMLRCLADSGLVYEDYSSGVILTPEGKDVVGELFSGFDEVYLFFYKFLKLPREEAHEQALLFVTDFPQDTCNRLKRIVRRTLKQKLPER